MASVPNSINAVSAAASGIQPTGGADAGVGFHSEQPVRIDRYDPTEQTQFKNRLEEEQRDIQPEAVATYPKYPESPFVRYVSRPLSNGELSNSVQSYKPEDRSHMGTPLNPFWIRNDMWSMTHEADIFADSGPNWVPPQVQAHTSRNLPGYDRNTYLDNQEQPQHSTEAAPIAKSNAVAPSAPAAGSVTSAVAASNQTQMEIPQSNPAIPNEAGTTASSEGKSTDVKVGDVINMEGEEEGSEEKEKKKPRSKRAPKKQKVSS
jgi:hypothetical protein